MSQPDSSMWAPQRYRRTQVRLTVHIATVDPETDPETGKPYFRSSSERCRDISRGGAFIETEEPVDAGRRLLVELEIPDIGRVETLARVTWSRRALTDASRDGTAGFGIEFLGTPVEQLAVLERYLARLERTRKPKSADILGNVSGQAV